ncbi:hypothetical protein QTP88_012432 [Uroleucon formosanum]
MFMFTYFRILNVDFELLSANVMSQYLNYLNRETFRYPRCLSILKPLSFVIYIWGGGIADATSGGGGAFVDNCSLPVDVQKKKKPSIDREYQYASKGAYITIEFSMSI